MLWLLSLFIVSIVRHNFTLLAALTTLRRPPRGDCSEKGMAIGSEGVQLLGGHGFVKEHPVERWYRDLRAAGVMEGALLV